MKNPHLLAVVAATAIAGLALTGCTNKNNTSASGASTQDTSHITVAFVPKLQGSPYYEAMNVGAQQAAQKLGIKWIMSGPTTADAAAQADVVRSFIQQKVSAIVVAPNDPNSMAPVLKQAADAGIKVLTADTDDPGSVRQVFVNQATDQSIGATTIDTLAHAMGGKGEFAIVSCGETASNLNAWIAAEKNYVATKYPDMKLDNLVYSGEDQAKGTKMARDLMNAHPNLTGLIGQCSTSAVGVAQAVRDAGKIGKVFTVGLGTPKSMAPYLHDGSSSGSVLWDVQALGYLTAWAGTQLAEGKSFSATNDVSSALPAVKYDDANKNLILGPPFVFTAQNVDKYNY